MTRGARSFSRWGRKDIDTEGQQVEETVTAIKKHVAGKETPRNWEKPAGKQGVDAHAPLPLQKLRDPSHVLRTKDLWRRWKQKV